jgi:hypothetical protein
VKRNGAKKAPPKSPDAEKIIESSKMRVAPTPTRTRSFVERTGPDLAKAAKKLEEQGTTEAAEQYVAALFSSKPAGAKQLERPAE